MSADPSRRGAAPVGADFVPALLAAGTAPAGPEPDALIVALCNEAVSLEAARTAEIAALDREGAFLGDPSPEQEAMDTALQATGKRVFDIVGLLCGIPSTTGDGTRAKAGVVLALNGRDGAASCEATPELAWVVCDELARGTARQEAPRA